MRWLNGYTTIEKVNRRMKKNEWKRSWSKWFTWYPVECGEKSGRIVKVWFSYVERRQKRIEHPQNYREVMISPWWEYRELKR